MIIDAETGLPPNKKTKKVIYESFKSQDKLTLDLENSPNMDILKKRNPKNQSVVLRFY